MNQDVVKQKALKYYSIKVFKRMAKKQSYHVVGETGNMSREDHYYIIKAFETGTEMKVYPRGTRHLVLDKKIGYVLTGFNDVVIIYEHRLKGFNLKKESKETTSQV